MSRRLALVVLAACLGGLMYVAIRAHRDLTDFQVYRTAASRAAHAEPLYRADDGHYQFKYLPAFAVVTRPLTWLGEESAKTAWFALSFCLVFVFLQTLVTHVPDRRLPVGLLTVVVAVVMAKYFVRELALGQTNALLGVLTLPAIVALRRRPVLAGLGVGAAIFVKPYAAILLPWLALGAPLAATVALAALVAGLVLPAVTYGWQGNLALLDEWRRTVTDTTAPNLLHPDNVSLVSFWTRWAGSGHAVTILTAASMLALAILALFVLRRGRQSIRTDVLNAGLLLLLIPVLSPQGWDYVLLLGTPVVVLTIDRWTDLPPAAKALAAFALVIFAFPLRLVASVDTYNAVMSTGVVTIAAVALVLVATTLRKRELA